MFEYIIPRWHNNYITVVARKINPGAEHRCQLRPVTGFSIGRGVEDGEATARYVSFDAH